MSFANAVVNAQVITQTFGTGANAFSMDFVEIGNPNNNPDTGGIPNPVGSVGYIYNISKHEISRDMVAKANNLGGMGITLGDISGLVSNSQANGPDQPVTLISWNEAARVVNWLNTSKGYQAAYNFTTSGHNDYITLWSAEESSNNGGLLNRFRHKDAYYFLPSVDEWYKAAYGSPSGNWYKYANGSENAPLPVAGGTGGAVYGGQQGLADIENAGGLSPFGTIAQGGNAWEWTETAADGINDTAGEYTEIRGGSLNDPLINISSTGRSGDFNPSSQHFNIGFRVASVPEPSALSLLAVGLGGLAMMRRRRS